MPSSQEEKSLIGFYIFQTEQLHEGSLKSKKVETKNTFGRRHRPFGLVVNNISRHGTP
jgi:hypothetical protein